jgi:ABC-2 type transport system permease protein
MRAIPILVITNFRLSYRFRMSFFFAFLLPVILTFAYFQIFGQGKASSVLAMVAPLITLSMMTNALLVAGMRSAQMRERDMYRQYHLTPLRSIDLVVSDLLLGYVTFLPIMLAQLAIARYVYGAAMNGSYLAVCLVCSFGFLPLAAFGLLLSTAFNSAQETAAVTQGLFLALMFLSGTTMPLDQLPGFLQRFAVFTPPAQIIVAIEGILVRHDGFVQILPELLALLLSGLTALVITALIFRWDKNEKVSPANRMRAVCALAPVFVLGILLNIGPRAGRWIPDIKSIVTMPTGNR